MTFGPPMVAERWPSTLLPSSCRFGRSRNDLELQTPRSRRETLIRRGRPLWTCELTFSAIRTDLPLLRYYVESLDGNAGSVMLWNFASPRPVNTKTVQIEIAQGLSANVTWKSGAFEAYWETATDEQVHWKQDSLVATPAIAAGAKSFAVRALPPSQKAMQKGEYIQIGRRLYVLGADLVTSSAGTGTINLMKPLISPVTAETELRVLEPACEMRLVGAEGLEEANANDPFHTVTLQFLETTSDFAAGGAAFIA